MAIKHKTPLEKTIVSAAIAWTNEQPNCWAYKAHGSMYSQDGIPDVIASINGVFVGVEFKRPKPDYRDPTKLQQQTLAKIKEANGYSTVLTSVADYKLFIQEILRHISEKNVKEGMPHSSNKHDENER